MKKIITISREHGSGGSAIGKIVAEKLGWKYYDKQLIDLAADESGLS
nr:cytidylate kinase-like family protein [Treponema sp.]